jgi:hypothetical protein
VQPTNTGHRRIEPPPTLVDKARSLIAEHGVRNAARLLNLGREATLAIAAGAKVDRGTVALAAQAIESQPK